MRKQNQQQPRDPSQPLRAVALIRMSSDQQQNSPERQREGFHDWCAHYNLVNVGEYDDMGISASKTKMVERPGIMRMWADAAEDVFDVAWAEETSRASRNLIETLQLHEYLTTLHIPFLDGREDPRAHYDPVYRTIITALKGGMAQGETMRMAIRIKGTMMKNAREGKYCGGAVSLGYVWTKDDGVTIDEEKAAVARRIFDLFMSVGSYTGVAKRANAEGLRGARGKGFTPNTVMRVLTGLAYRGQVKWGGELVAFSAPPIIDEATLQTVDAMLLQITHRPQRCTRADSVFAGLVRCPTCERFLGSVNHGGTQRALRCDRAYHQPRPCSNTRTIGEQKYEATLLPQVLAKLNERADSIDAGSLPKKVALDIEAKLVRLDGKVEREKNMYANDLRTWDELQANLAEIKVMQDELRGQQKAPSSVTSGDLRKMARRIEKTWSQQDATGKRTLLQSMIAYIVPDYDNKAASQIVWLAGR